MKPALWENATARRGVSRSPSLLGLGTARPSHHVAQAEARAFASRVFAPALSNGSARLLHLFDRSGVSSRSVSMPLSWYERPHTFGETNDLYVACGLELSAEAAAIALGAAGLEPAAVDHVVFVSTTGVAAPSLDARLANRMRMRPDVRRTPVWGLGCAGGAAGLGLARDLALAEPEGVVLLVALELCSLTFQPQDLDRRNLVASALFSDGAAACVVAGANAGVGRSPRLEVVARGSTLWPDTLEVMGWTVDPHGLHVVFSPEIPALVATRLRPAVDEFLGRQGIALADVAHVLAHPGGPKVMTAVAEALERDPESLRHARDVLRECGNMSSPTCLFVLERAVRQGEIAPGDNALLLALGPGFALEQVLLRASRP